MQSLGDLLATVFFRRKWDQRLALHQVFLFWESAVGREIASHARPDLIRQNVLWLKVADPVWMQQMHFNKQLLLDRINNRLQGDVAFTDIRFQLGYAGEFSAEEQSTPAAVRENTPHPPRSIPAVLADALAGVEEDGLREAIQSAFQRSER